MRYRLRIISGLIAALLVGLSAGADTTNTVSLVGRNVDTSDPNTVGITLSIATGTWSESEPGNRHHFFKTDKGKYFVVAPNLVILRDQNNTVRVGQLNPIQPQTAKKGDVGTGKSDETGVAFSWEVK
jgi:hypothetical protein